MNGHIWRLLEVGERPQIGDECFESRKCKVYFHSFGRVIDAAMNERNE